MFMLFSNSNEQKIPIVVGSMMASTVILAGYDNIDWLHFLVIWQNVVVVVDDDDDDDDVADAAAADDDDDDDVIWY